MSGYVYFIACEPMDAVKIGYTRTHPDVRLSALQTGCPSPLKLLCYLPADMQDERRLHETFRPLHIQGEWFRLEWKLCDFVTYLDDGNQLVTRDAFENALHDVVMQGLWYPNSPITEDRYGETADWQPFRELLWEAFGPWEDE